MINNNILAVVARMDLDSMNPGKLAAQVCHAGTQSAILLRDNEEFQEWAKEADNFGTTLVLGVENKHKFDMVYEIITESVDPSFNASGIIFDPTYPVRDGQITHLIPIETCFWVFGDRYFIMDFFKLFDIRLYP